MTLNLIMLQGTAGAGGDIAKILMIVALIAVFYFFMIRPQQKKQKEIRKFREGIKVGDRVVTAGGIYGKIRGVKETTFQLEITSGVCITIDKGSVYPSAEVAQADAQNEETKK